jgi:hypothetical protein
VEVDTEKRENTGGRGGELCDSVFLGTLAGIVGLLNSGVQCEVNECEGGQGVNRRQP